MDEEVRYDDCPTRQAIAALEEAIKQQQDEPEGWIQDKRPDKPIQYYLMFPGN